MVWQWEAGFSALVEDFLECRSPIVVRFAPGGPGPIPHLLLFLSFALRLRPYLCLSGLWRMRMTVNRTGRALPSPIASYYVAFIGLDRPNKFTMYIRVRVHKGFSKRAPSFPFEINRLLLTVTIELK